MAYTVCPKCDQRIVHEDYPRRLNCPFCKFRVRGPPKFWKKIDNGRDFDNPFRYRPPVTIKEK
jgi:uncharacterized CHY-type Zn-finger protein